MLCLEEFKGLCLSESAAGLGVVLQDEIHEGLADDHAHLGWLAGVFPSVATGTFENSHIRRPLEYQIPSHGIRDDLLQVSQRNLLVKGDDGLGLLLRKHLAVIVVGPPPSPSRPYARKDVVDGQINVLVGPASIDIYVQSTKVEESP